jgi:hypothetical protein
MASENGPIPCNDCFGEGRPPSQGARIEWRLREIERIHRGSGREVEADVLWLIHEVRHSRDALVRIFARCQDADEGDETARVVRFEANEALGLFDLEAKDLKTNSR